MFRGFCLNFVQQPCTSTSGQSAPLIIAKSKLKETVQCAMSVLPCVFSSPRSPNQAQKAVKTQKKDGEKILQKIYLHSIEEGWREKHRRRSSLLFGGQMFQFLAPLAILPRSSLEVEHQNNPVLQNRIYLGIAMLLYVSYQFLILKIYSAALLLQFFWASIYITIEDVFLRS